MLSEPTPKRRWPRTQHFTLSTRGQDAERGYQAAIVASREQSGRASFDAARAEWARGLGVEPDDGPWLGELRAGPTRLDALVEALETSGKTRKDAVEALERLFDAGLVATVES